MKGYLAAAVAVVAAGAYAQVSYTTITYDDCPMMPPESMITVTDGVTVTFCPECEMGGYTTIYTTVYKSLCPTGIVPATYTVTESCPGPGPTWTPGPGHIPQGFTVTTKMCDVCDKTPMRVTITEPCGCEAHEGTPAPNWHPAPTSPSEGGSGGWSPGASPGGSSPGAAPTPGSGSPECYGEECRGSVGQGSSPGHGPVAPPYPTTGMESCPGPNCRARPTGGLPHGVSYGNTSSNTPSMMPPYHSTASTLSSLTLISSFAAFVVAALAFAL